MRKINLPYDYLAIHSLYDLKVLLKDKSMWTPKTVEIINNLIKNKSNPV